MPDPSLDPLQATKPAAPKPAPVPHHAAAPASTAGTAGPTGAHHAWVLRHFGVDTTKLHKAPAQAKGVQAGATPSIAGTPKVAGPFQGGAAPSRPGTAQAHSGAQDPKDDPNSLPSIILSKFINTFARTSIKARVLHRQKKNPWDTTNIFEAKPGEPQSIANHVIPRGREGARAAADAQKDPAKIVFQSRDDAVKRMNDAKIKIRRLDKAHIPGWQKRLNAAAETRTAAEQKALGHAKAAGEAQDRVDAVAKAEEAARAEAEHRLALRAAAMKDLDAAKQAANDAAGPAKKAAELRAAEAQAKAEAATAAHGEADSLLQKASRELTSAKEAATKLAAVEAKAVEGAGKAAEAHVAAGLKLAENARALTAERAVLRHAGEVVKMKGTLPTAVFESGWTSAKLGGPLSGAISAGLAFASDASEVHKGKMTKSHLVADVAVQGGTNIVIGGVSAWAGAEAGAAVGTMFAPGVGTLVGGAVGAVVTLGLNVAGSYELTHANIKGATMEGVTNALGTDIQKGWRSLFHHGTKPPGSSAPPARPPQQAPARAASPAPGQGPPKPRP